MAKCVKCGKEIIPSQGYYGYPSGIECVRCGDMREEPPSMEKMQKFILKIARMECGCAPSAGYMEEIILEARKVLNIKTNY